MRKVFLSFFLLFCICPLFALTDLELGAKVPNDATQVEHTLIVAAPAQLQELYKWSDSEANYLLGVDQDGYVQFICVDSFINTDQAINVGDEFSKIKKIPSTKIVYWFEWGYCVELPSGWILQFENNEYYDFYIDGLESFRPENKKISDNATVKQIFKGTRAGYGQRK